MHVCAAAILAAALLGSPAVNAAPELVRAAPIRGTDVLSPRQLFNAGLEEEDHGNVTGAVQYFLSARLSPRRSFADELYARGAGYRLVRILAGYDDDAAAAAAMLISTKVRARADSDLAPLVRTLLRRLDDDDGRGADLETTTGVIASVRYKARSGRAIIEMKTDDDQRRLVLADGRVGPFSAGDPVRILMRRDRKRALAGWRLVAIAHLEADGWQMLAVSGLPGQAGDEYGALLRH